MISLLLADASASPDPWAIAGRIGVVVTIVSSGVGVVAWRIVLRAVMAAGLRLAKSDLKEVEEDIWSERMHDQAVLAARVDRLANESGVQADQIVALEASSHAQGKALIDQFSNGLQQMTHSMEESAARQTKSMEVIAENSNAAYERVTVTIERMREEHTETAKEVAEISGILKAWDGPDRRTQTRKRRA